MADEKQTAKAADEKPKTTTRKKSSAEDAFPYAKDNYISTPSTARNSHSDGDAVRFVQEHLGVKVTGSFDDKTREAVLDYQRKNDLDVSGVVDADTWDHMKGA